VSDVVDNQDGASKAILDVLWLLHSAMNTSDEKSMLIRIDGRLRADGRSMP
jgi:hypothetical protein